MRGLKVKLTYEDLIEVAYSDWLVQIEFPNRDYYFFEMVFSYRNLTERGRDRCNINKNKQLCKDKHITCINTGF